MLLYITLSGRTPFASTPNDEPETILKRIGSGQIDLDNGVENIFFFLMKIINLINFIIMIDLNFSDGVQFHWK